MLRPLRLLLCASTAALIVGAAPVGGFVRSPLRRRSPSPSARRSRLRCCRSTAQPPIPRPGIHLDSRLLGLGRHGILLGAGLLGDAAGCGPRCGRPATGAGTITAFTSSTPDTGARPSAIYGGIDYGFGYTGFGYQGGYWRDHQFYYNRAMNNLGVRRTSPPCSTSRFRRRRPTRVSFNGGNGGTTARPTPAELAPAREHHIAPTAAQVEHQQAASKMADLRFNANHGQPPIAAVERPNDFHGAHVGATASRRSRGGSGGCDARGGLAASRRPADGASAGRGSRAGDARASRSGSRLTRRRCVRPRSIRASLLTRRRRTSAAADRTSPAPRTSAAADRTSAGRRIWAEAATGRPEQPDAGGSLGLPAQAPYLANAAPFGWASARRSSQAHRRQRRALSSRCVLRDRRPIDRGGRFVPIGHEELALCRCQGGSREPPIREAPTLSASRPAVNKINRAN